jgi:GTP cyclohydrolase I
MVVVRGQHLCMMARGVRKENAVMVTSAIKGVFEKKEARDEFMNLIA